MIFMRKQEDRGKQYTGGGIISRERFHYGYYEARAKMFGGAGWHESIWAMAVTAMAALRILQHAHRNRRTGIRFRQALERPHGPDHLAGTALTAKTAVAPRVCAAAHWASTPQPDFHTYGFEYTEQKVRYYLDGELRCSSTIRRPMASTMTSTSG